MELGDLVRKMVRETPVVDMHTHLFPPAFGDLLLSGIDELLTYHYLIAETARVSPLGEGLLSHPIRRQAEEVWHCLFHSRSPISEACQGVVHTLQLLGFDPRRDTLGHMRTVWGALPIEERIDRVFELAGVESAVMTNDPFDSTEIACWREGRRVDGRLVPALRIDPLLNAPAAAATALAEQGFAADTEGQRAFLRHWIAKMRPAYMAVSLPPDFGYPEDTPRGRAIREVVLPVAREFGVPFALMIGVRRAVNPRLGLAGDGQGHADLSRLAALLAENPDVRFLATVLARENHHELCVLGRKFPNLLVFGCWWFVNNPSLIREITHMRLEMLGMGFVPQHSDARVLEQLVYKWTRSREVIGDVLAEHYQRLSRAGWHVHGDEVRRDVSILLSGNFEGFRAKYAQ